MRVIVCDATLRQSDEKKSLDCKVFRCDDNSEAFAHELRRIENMSERGLWNTRLVVNKGNAYNCVVFMAFRVARRR